MVQLIDNLYRGLVFGFGISVFILITLFYGQFFESTFFAPYDKFYGVTVENNSLDIFAIKRRDCAPLLETLAVSQKINGIETRIRFEINENELIQKPAGLNSFGIWKFNSDSTDNLQVIISHNCGNPLWDINRRYDIVVFSSYKELEDLVFNK